MNKKKKGMPVHSDNDVKKHSVHPETEQREPESKASDTAKKKSEKTTIPSDAAEPSKGTSGTRGTSPDDTASTDLFPIVGIGSSAGGLEALETFFTHLSPETGMAFIVVAHTSSEHESMLPELIRRKTKMEVQEIKEELKAKPNHVYLPPSNRDATLDNGVFHLENIKKSLEKRLPIDHLFKSLAMDQQEMAACIVLSGTGSDGSAGLKAVKEHGGMVMVQDVNSAKFAGMPQSAIDTGLIDYVSPPQVMPDQLSQYFAYIVRRDHSPELTEEDRFQRNIGKIIIMLGARSGHDFSYYKKGTLVRRIERRMSVRHMDTIEKYISFLHRNPEEVTVLFQELLIGVTNFFRDPEAFDYLKREVLPDLLLRDKADPTFRVWVCGCSTGEEVYSVNILLLETMEELGISKELQLFGTDIDAVAVDKARDGVYPENIGSDVTAQRLEKFFAKTDHFYRIRKELREPVVFAVQDVMRDPPFSRLDLLVCRNLLIYLEPAAQKKLIPLFHYTLKPDGVLFLGASETVGRFTDLFSPVSKKWNIYHKNEVGAAAKPAIDFPMTKRFTPPVGLKGREPVPAPRWEDDLADGVRSLLVEKYVPPCVVVNREGDIAYIMGRTGDYLEPPQGRPTMNILSMAREGLRFDLSSALRKVAETNEEVVREGLQVRKNGGMAHLKLVVSPIRNRQGLSNMIMVLFVEKPEPAANNGEECGEERLEGKNRHPHDRIVELENALQKSREDNKIALEELETSNEELKSVNEEMQSSYEELQSTNEELESSKEELQSLNEEMNTVNSELHEKIEELSESYDVINSLLNAAKIALVVLDNELRVVRFTAEATKLINLIPSDVGRPLEHVSTNIENNRLLEDVREVLQRLTPKEAEVATRDGQWYLMRIVPYRSPDHKIEGAVLTFINIGEEHALRLGRNQDEAAKKFAEEVVDTLREAVLILDGELRVVSANRTFYGIFQVRPEDTVGRPIQSLGNGQWDIPPLRELLTRALRQGESFRDFAVEFEFPPKGTGTMLLLNGRRLALNDATEPNVLLAIEDVSGKERRE